MREQYTLWLMSQIEIMEGDGYSRLCAMMQDIPFLPFLEMDVNRGDDGMALRGEWAESVGGTDDEILKAMYELDRELGGGTCTMLELAVILARKLCYEMMDGPHEASIRKWFVEMMDNCGLSRWNDAEIENHPGEAEDAVLELIGNVIFHRYGWDGEGSLFPLRYANEDQRQMDLMTQMNNYIAENYDIC